MYLLVSLAATVAAAVAAAWRPRAAAALSLALAILALLALLFVPLGMVETGTVTVGPEGEILRERVMRRTIAQGQIERVITVGAIPVVAALFGTILASTTGARAGTVVAAAILGLFLGLGIFSIGPFYAPATAAMVVAAIAAPSRHPPTTGEDRGRRAAVLSLGLAAAGSVVAAAVAVGYRTVDLDQVPAWWFLPLMIPPAVAAVPVLVASGRFVARARTISAALLVVLAVTGFVFSLVLYGPAAAAMVVAAVRAPGQAAGPSAEAVA